MQGRFACSALFGVQAWLCVSKRTRGFGVLGPWPDDWLVVMFELVYTPVVSRIFRAQVACCIMFARIELELRVSEQLRSCFPLATQENLSELSGGF